MKLLRKAPMEIALHVIEEASKSPLTANLVTPGRLDAGSLFRSPEETRILLAPELGNQPIESLEARDYFLRQIRKEVF